MASFPLPRGLIVSCQAPVDSPLHDPNVIGAIAQASVMRGAVGVRLDSPAHVQAVRERLPEVLIIGLWKRQYPDSSVYITPCFDDAAAIAAAGADVIALDCTLRPRPKGETFPAIIERIHRELGKAVMADIDTLEAGIAAAAAGADWIGTTLYGYTEATQGFTPPGFDILSHLSERFATPILCEGGISSPDQAAQALRLGSGAIVVGTAITGIDAQVAAYVQALQIL
jgi:N-acylglucosamine-6-phosphate 2-epimerase